MAGICRHDVSPNDGTAVGPDLWRKDIEMMKACNINAIRTSRTIRTATVSTICATSSACTSSTSCPTAGRRRTTRRWSRRSRSVREKRFAATRTIRRVLIWTIGNENKDGRNLQAVADLVKEMDTTRPRDVSCMGSKYNTELSDSHYTDAQTEVEASAKSARSEASAHLSRDSEHMGGAHRRRRGLLGSVDAVLQRSVGRRERSEAIPGMFLLGMEDRAVADKNETKLYFDFPERRNQPT